MDGELHFVSLTDVQRVPDLLRQRQLRLGPYLHPGAGQRPRPGLQTALLAAAR
jgi:hypothetical protein